MAKGQQRGNREPKKPKQNKLKAPAAPATLHEKMSTPLSRPKAPRS